jgi:FkbM family methyltransferase
MLMKIKKFLRRFGFDIVRYHSFWDHVARPRGIKMILDIGAHGGESASEMRQRFPEAEILSFEPLQEFYEKLLATMEGDQHFHAYHMALGAASGESVIHRSASAPSSSLLPMGELHKKLYPGSGEYTDERIRVLRLDDALDMPIARPLLVKIDVQGFEAEVIKGATHTLAQTDIVVVENSFTPLYEGQALFGDIHDLLRSLGFSYRGRSETHYNSLTGEPIYEDSVFMRE